MMPAGHRAQLLEDRTLLGQTGLPVVLAVAFVTAFRCPIVSPTPGAYRQPVQRPGRRALHTHL